MSQKDVTSEGHRLISLWLGAKESLERAKSSVRSAECDVANTERALAKWLMPEDMKPDEKIGVWYGDSLIQVELQQRTASNVEGNHTVSRLEPVVTVRSRGKEFHRLRLAS